MAPPPLARSAPHSTQYVPTPAAKSLEKKRMVYAAIGLTMVLGAIGLWGVIAVVKTVISKPSKRSAAASASAGGAASFNASQHGQMADFQAHTTTMQRVQNVGMAQAAFMNETGQFATNLADLTSLPEDQRFDGWDVRLSIIGTRVVSGGKDHALNTSDDIWFDFQLGQMGGALPQMNLQEMQRETSGMTPGEIQAMVGKMQAQGQQNANARMAQIQKMAESMDGPAMGAPSLDSSGFAAPPSDSSSGDMSFYDPATIATPVPVEDYSSGNSSDGGGYDDSGSSYDDSGSGAIDDGSGTVDEGSGDDSGEGSVSFSDGG